MLTHQNQAAMVHAAARTNVKQRALAMIHVPAKAVNADALAASNAD